MQVPSISIFSAYNMMCMLWYFHFPYIQMDQGSLVTSSKLICLLEAGWEFSPISGRFCLVLCLSPAVCTPRSQAKGNDSSCKNISILTLIFLADIKMTAKQGLINCRVGSLSKFFFFFGLPARKRHCQELPYLNVSGQNSLTFLIIFVIATNIL